MNRKFRAAALAVLTVACLTQIATTANAGTFGGKNLSFNNSSALHLIAQQGISSANIGVVHYPGGRFIRKSGKNWVEQTDTGTSFQFVETGYDETAVYLIDRSRNVQIALDVSPKQVLYAEGTDPFSELYQITGMKQTNQGIDSSNPTRSQVMTYSCNEGIPLVVRYEFGGQRDKAFASHDGFPEVRLIQVPSGSGSAYISGKYELYTKGRSATFIFNGSQDVCHEQ